MAITLYLPQPFQPSGIVPLEAEQCHYLNNVMRQKTGDTVRVFNGQDGQWDARIVELSKKTGSVQLVIQRRPQRQEPDIWLCFAPVKNAPINTLVQKATELGVSRLMPVITQHTVVTRVNTERLHKIAVEAAEQCERLSIPTIEEPIKLAKLLEGWSTERGLILCDESGQGQPFGQAMVKDTHARHALLIGPEGGFSQSEFEMLRKQPYIIPVGMGPRILRADTAAMAALTCYQSTRGDWHELPHYQP